MSQTTHTRPFLVRLFTHNGWLKLVSLIFAIFLYLIVRSEQVREFTKVAKVRVLTAPDTIVVGPSERAVDVTVRFPGSIFFRQPVEKELLGVIDATHDRMGKIRIRLTRENFPDLDKRFTLVIHDPWLEIDLDKRDKKKVSVRAVLQGLPKEGLSIDRVIVEPREVEVSGARREISKIETLSTSPINIELIDRNFSSLTKLVFEESSSIRVSHDKVNVQVIVGPEKVSRVLKGVPVMQAASRWEVRPGFIDLEVQGQKDYVNALKVSDFHASLDVQGVGGEWQERKVVLKIPANTSLVRVTPDTVSVRQKR